MSLSPPNNGFEVGSFGSDNNSGKMKATELMRAQTIATTDAVDDVEELDRERKEDLGGDLEKEKNGGGGKAERKAERIELGRESRG